MADFALEAPERALLAALTDLGVRFMIVGATAASMQGARVATEDIDMWFSNLDDPRLREAARRAGGIWIAATFGMQPPTFGGAIGDRFDVVLSMSGLASFEVEYRGAKALAIDDVPVRVLPLRRIIVSKRAAGRPKDRAALPALEAALAVIEDEEDR
jgi:predicted nucleotidyltransferase